MILDRPDAEVATVAKRLGWDLKPEGLCRDAVCVPLRDHTSVDALAAALRRPLVEDRKHKLRAIGPETGRAILSARAPELRLPAWGGGEFALNSLLGQKVVIIAWAPW